MKKDSLTNDKKKSIIRTDGVLSFNRAFFAVKTKIKTLCKGHTDWKIWRMVRHTFGKFVILLRRFEMNITFKKISGLAVGVALAILVGCGGGGGGGSTPPPTTVTQTVTCPDGTSKTGTGTTTTSALDAATAQCAAPTLVSITPADKATGISPDTIGTSGIVVATSSTLATPAISDITLKAGTTSVPVTVTMTAGNKGFKFVPSTKLLFAQLYNGTIKITDTLGKILTVPFSFTTASVSCTAPLEPDSAGTSCVPPVCPTGTAWNGAICATTVLRYADKTYAIWTYAYPYAVTKTGVTKVVNKTSYPLLAGNVYSLSKCWLPEKALADGKVLVNCQEPIGNTRKVFYIDPTKEEMYDYAGAVPTDIVWHDVTPVNAVLQQPSWGSQAKVTSGWFYTVGTSTWVLWFLDDKTGTSAIVKAGTLQADGNINYMNSYTN